MHWLIIKLGDGNIAVGYGVVDKDVPCLTFQLMSKPGEVGKPVNEDDIIKNSENICIAFTNIDSLNVLEHQLNELKKKHFVVEKGRQS